MTTKPQNIKPWRLHCPQLRLWAGLDERAQIIPCETPTDPRVQVFDERDNQEMKRRFYTAITGIAWEVQCAF